MIANSQHVLAKCGEMVQEDTFLQAAVEDMEIASSDTATAQMQTTFATFFARILGELSAVQIAKAMVVAKPWVPDVGAVVKCMCNAS